MTEPALYIGIMSGTSLDGVDLACCRFTPKFELLTQHFQPMPESLYQRLQALQSAQADELHEAMVVAGELAEWYAQATAALLETNNIPRTRIRAIGCHGQTIRHRPAAGYSVQLNQPARLAELSQIDVIADFRARDIAAGGQGAPLVPAFHRAQFLSAQQHRAIVNIGGMANITDLPPNGPTRGFDCGPGNVLMDAWIHNQLGQRLDHDGAWAAQGQVIPTLLAQLKSHPFFAAPPPKSCGREEFNLAWLKNHLSGSEDPVDVQATLLELTARSIAEAIHDQCTGVEEVYLCGGGARNTRLRHRIAHHLRDCRVDSTEALGLAVDAVEAAAFAWLAHAFIARQPANLPEVTGASGPRILGALYPA